MKHIRTLDGIRGIAVLFVMFFHLQITGFSLGWAGVPIFFCLSGFLITGILLEKKDQPFKKYIRSFLINRSLRIFPLFYAYLLVNFLYLIVTGKPTAGYIWFVFYLQNIYIGLTGSTPGFLIQTWSLAAEEQFYWLWPFAIFFIKNKNMVKIFAILILFSALARGFIVHLSGDNPNMYNVSLLSCTDALILGALFAKIKDYEHVGRVALGVFTVGLVTALYAITTTGLEAFWLPSGWVNKCGYLGTSIAMISTAIIYYAYKIEKNASNNIISKLLKSRFLVYTGKISYGLYMWHLACFFAITLLFRRLGVDEHGGLYNFVSLVSVYIVATLSFYLYEVHFLKLKKNPGSAPIPSVHKV